MKWAVHVVYPSLGKTWRVAGDYPRKSIADQVAKDLTLERAGDDGRYVVIRQLGR